MPKLVEKLTEQEEKFVYQIKNRYTDEQLCAYFLTKTIRSIYQFDDKFILGWYEEIFNCTPNENVNARVKLVQEYTLMLIVEHKFKFHLEYWIRQYQNRLISEIDTFFSGKGGE